MIQRDPHKPRRPELACWPPDIEQLAGEVRGLEVELWTARFWRQLDEAASVQARLAAATRQLEDLKAATVAGEHSGAG